MFLHCLHAETGRTEFDLQEGSSHRCLLYILKSVRVPICQTEKVPEVQLCDCWTAALFEAIFCSFFSLLLLVSGLLESVLTHNFHIKHLCHACSRYATILVSSCISTSSAAARRWSVPKVPRHYASSDIYARGLFFTSKLLNRRHTQHPVNLKFGHNLGYRLRWRHSVLHNL